MFYPILLLLILVTACSPSSNAPRKKSIKKHELISRTHNDFSFTPAPAKPAGIPLYPWESPLVGNHPAITKEFFRCKGSSQNPVRLNQESGEIVRYFDCGGAQKHSLPLQNGKEFVYPILVELLNYIQAQTGKRVTITSGHRCPEHNSYCDPSIQNQSSKHTLGAEVAFYVQGFENKPEKIIALIQNFYKQQPLDLSQFQRYTKADTDVTTAPWYNKEIFIKLYKKEEGRNFDNRHPFPYISIQVRHDRLANERVLYSWQAAHKNYLRK